MRALFLLIALFLTTAITSQNSFMLAENYFRQGEYEKAAQIYQNLFSKNRFNNVYLKRLITCYQETDQFNQAQQLLETALFESPKLTYFKVELGYNFERQQQTEKATLYYQEALNDINSNPAVGGLTGKFFKDNNLLDFALQAYQKTMELNPNANYNFYIAQIYGEQGKFDLMFTSYAELLDKNDNYLGTVQRFASKYITEDKTNSGNIAFKKALLRKSISNPKDVWNILLSWLFTKQKEYQKALIQEKALFKRNPEYLEGINNLGDIAFDNDDFITSKSCYDFVIKNTNHLPEKINAELALLKTSIALNESEIDVRFTEVLNQYGANQSTIAIQVAHADYLTFNTSNPEKAELILDKALSLAKDKFEQAKIKIKLGDIFVFTNRFNKALVYYSQVQTKLKNHRLSQEARFKVAKTSFYKSDFAWATSQLKVLKGSTSQLIANDAVELFLVISENAPKDSIPSGLKEFAKADLLAFQNKRKEAISLYQQVLKDYQGQSIEDNTLFRVAKLYLKEKQFDDALLHLQKIIDADKLGPLVDDAYFYIADIYQHHLNNTEKASEYYQKIIFEQPSSIHLVEARKRYRELRGDNLN